MTKTKIKTLQAAYNGYYAMAMKLKSANELQAANAYAASALKILERIKKLNEQNNTNVVLPLQFKKAG